MNPPSGSDLEERVRGLESVFGTTDKMHLHGVIPFFMGFDVGGTADAVTFSSFTPQGKLYVSCELVGTEEQPPNEAGQYELAVCQKEPEDWALGIMLNLCHYTLESVLEDGDTMDIRSAVPSDSGLDAFLFRRIAIYDAFGKPANVICCLGITGAELALCQRKGSEALLALMPSDFILTKSKRPSFV